MAESSFAIELLATLIKVVIMIAIGAQMAPIMSWVERKQMALIQRRVGPNRVGVFKLRVFGLGQPLADAVKLLFKEDFVPSHVNRFFYIAAPILTCLFGLLACMAIPIGRYVEVSGVFINLQAVSLNAGFLFIFAMSGLGVYGVALAGWSSNNKYSLLGGLRASAQMVSYELGMGLSLTAMVLIYGTLDLQQIVALQTAVAVEGGGYEHQLLFGFLPNWGIFYAPVAFVVFLITVFAETNRLPFDLAEGESELVAGFLTEYGSMRWSLFFMGEYAMMFALSALMAILFFGGYEIPWLPQYKIVEMLSGVMSEQLALFVTALIGLGVLIAKVAMFMFMFVQVRFTLPRFRYDQLMRLGWYWLLPIALANLMITGIVLAIVRF